MGYKYDEAEFLAEAIALVRSEGLARLTFGRLAKRLNVSDRSIVYYFPTKADLVTRTVMALGVQLQDLLSEAFGDQPLDADDLIARAWPVLASPRADPVIATFFELVGLAMAREQPYVQLADDVMGTWIDWLRPLVIAPVGEAEGAVLALIARLDGVLLLRHVRGADAAAAAFRADRAAGQSGLQPPA